MVISGMQKLTLLDYPGKTACLIFTQGCNFRCPFCHNRDLLDDENHCEEVFEEDVIKYLNKRKGLIDGICISGGEPLLQNDLEDFIIKVKKMGFLVKLDTNGSSPSKLKRLIDKGLIDYVAMDIKNDFTKYDKTAGIEKIKTDNIKRSIQIIENSGIDYEFRTTIVKQFHNLCGIENICGYIGPNSKYYIQNYRDAKTVLQHGLSGFDDDELRKMQDKLKLVYPNVIVRGI